MKIRKAEKDDAEGIVETRSKAWQYNYKDILEKEDLEYTKKDFKKEVEMRKKQILSKKELIQYVAEIDEDKIVGWLAGDRPKKDSENRDKELELHTLYIRPGYQNKGIGKKMFNGYCTYLNSNNVNSLFLWVLKENMQARKFYEKMGGKLIDEKDYRDKYRIVKY